MQIAHIRWVLQVAERKSITQAAKALYATPSSVSEAVRSIEAKIGVVLFERSVRGMALTPDGHRLLPKLRSIVDAHDQLIDASADLSALANPLTINSFLGYGGPNIIALNDASLSAADAPIRVRTLPYFDWSDPTADVRNRTVDAVLIGGPTAFDQELVRRDVERLPIIAILNESILPGRDMVSVADLDSVGWILAGPAIADERYFRFWTLNSIRGGPAPGSGALAEHPGQVQTIVAQGGGVIASIEPVAQRFSVGRQRIVPIEGSPMVNISLVYRRDHPSLEALDMVAGALAASTPLSIDGP